MHTLYTEKTKHYTVIRIQPAIVLFHLICLTQFKLYHDHTFRFLFVLELQFVYVGAMSLNLRKFAQQTKQSPVLSDTERQSTYGDTPTKMDTPDSQPELEKMELNGQNEPLPSITTEPSLPFITSQIAKTGETTESDQMEVDIQPSSKLVEVTPKSVEMEADVKPTSPLPTPPPTRLDQTGVKPVNTSFKHFF